MPSVKQQTIPSELSDLYVRSLGITRKTAYPGGYHPTLDETALLKYNKRMRRGKYPSATQLAQRAIFKSASDSFHYTTENERRAYYRLSKITGWEYRNYFMSRTILAFMAGQTWAQLARPFALSLMSGSGYKSGLVYRELHDVGPRALSYDLTLDVASNPTGIIPCSSGSYSIVHSWWDQSQTPPVAACACLKTFTPTERMLYSGNISVPATPPQSPFFYRYLDFARDSDTASEAAVWQFATDAGGDTLYGYLFD